MTPMKCPDCNREMTQAYEHAVWLCSYCRKAWKKGEGMSNPLVEMKEVLLEIALECGDCDGTLNSCPWCGPARKALKSLEKSGWNLEAFPELIAACEELNENYAGQGAAYEVAQALAKLKVGK